MRRQKVIFGHLIRLVCVMILFLSQVDLLCADAVAADIQKVEARADIPVDGDNGLSLDLNEQFCRTSLRIVGLEPRLDSFFSLILNQDGDLSDNFSLFDFGGTLFWRTPCQAVYCVFRI